MARKQSRPRTDSPWRSRYLAGRPSARKTGIYFPDRDLLWTRDVEDEAREEDDQDLLRRFAVAREREELPVVLVPPGHALHLDLSVQLNAGKLAISRYRTRLLIECAREPQTDADGNFVQVDGHLVPGSPMFDERDLSALESSSHEVAGPLALLCDAVMSYVAGLSADVVDDDEESVELTPEEIAGNSAAGS